MISRAFYRGIRERIKYDGMNLLEAVKEELYMIRKIMGFKLYVKYKNGIAVEGKDFFVNN